MSEIVHRSAASDELVASIVSRMNRHIIVMGYKFLGMYVVEHLRGAGVEFVVVVRDETQLPSLHRAGIPAIGSPIARSFQTLKDAGVSRASAIICTFDDDGDNMLSILNAKKLNPSIRAITVLNDKDLVEAAVASGADVAVAPYELTGQILAMSTVSNGVSGVFVRGQLKSKMISEFIFTAGEPMSYAEINRIAPVIMVARRGSLLTNPVDDFKFETGDILYVLTDPASLVELEGTLRERGALGAQ